MLEKYGIAGSLLSNSCVLPYDTWNLFKIRIYPHTTSGDTPIKGISPLYCIVYKTRHIKALSKMV